MNEKGGIRGILLVLIPGLILVSISLFWIFSDYFTQEEIDWQLCRESVVLRGALPDATVAKFTSVYSFKDEFPLKCKTQVIEIDGNMLETGKGFPTITAAAVTDLSTNSQGKEEGILRAEQLIAETIAQCWATFGNGDASIFPGELYGFKSNCVPCARIHLTDSAKKYLGSRTLDIEGGLKRGLDDSYYNYLMYSGEKFPALSFGGGKDFNLRAEYFGIWEDSRTDATIRNRLSGEAESCSDCIAKVDLPKEMKPDRGDLLIGYGALVSSDGKGVGNYVPYIFYFQLDQKEEKPFEQLGEKTLVDGFLWSNSAMCESWEGIPA